MTLFENAEPHDDEVNVTTGGRQVLENKQSKLESSENLSAGTLVQIPIQATAPPSAVVAEIDNEPLKESESADLVKPVIDERYIAINEEKLGVQLEGLEKRDCFDMAKSEVKVESVEIGIQPERIPDVASEAGQELQKFEKDLPQQKSSFDAAELKVKADPSNHDIIWRGECREVVNGVPDVEGNDAKDVVDLKSDEDGDLNDLKRSSEPKQQEPAKRMRRWNSGDRVAGDTLKPLTSGTVKEIMLPESRDGLSAVGQRGLQKVVATSRSLPPKVNAESEHGSNTRSVPPSTRAPSNSLKVERFVRPFTLKAVKDLLAEFGDCTGFWMDQIKTHCFVSYSSVDEAVAARNGLYHRQWPPSVGSLLIADYVDSNEVKIRSEGLPEKAQAAPAAPPSRSPDPIRAPLRVSQPFSSFRSDSVTLPMPRFLRGGQFPSVPPEPAVPTLDDLFLKTKAKPHIYYLPLTDEQLHFFWTYCKDECMRQDLQSP
ncbi:hypothetical protein GOP47_0007791 [Adiantum capillus-veneris]|uniref:Uncharacterized protein n=1 Tax=Adiantum capillus-veneris TaxID=13818 RepID=A0A9D4V2X2_ADICA|nr:hypothetical protein GOP47_0007791 [Adiantum capillus-veneris]